MKLPANPEKWLNARPRLGPLPQERMSHSPVASKAGRIDQVQGFNARIFFGEISPPREGAALGCFRVFPILSDDQSSSTHFGVQLVFGRVARRFALRFDLRLLSGNPSGCGICLKNYIPATGVTIRTGSSSPASIIRAGNSGFRVNVRRRNGLASNAMISEVFMWLPKARKSFHVRIGRRKIRCRNSSP